MVDNHAPYKQSFKHSTGKLSEERDISLSSRGYSFDNGITSNSSLVDLSQEWSPFM